MNPQTPEGRTLFLAEAPDEVGRPVWREAREVGFDSLLARAYFYRTPDSGVTLEPVPLMVEIAASSSDWVKAKIRQQYVYGAAQITEVENVSIEPFTDAAIQSLLRSLLSDDNE